MIVGAVLLVLHDAGEGGASSSPREGGAASSLADLLLVHTIDCCDL